MVTRYDDLPLYEPQPPRRGVSDDRRRRLRRTIKWLSLGLAIVVAAVGVYAGATYFHFIGSIDRRGGVISGSDKPGQAQNILLIGNDQRPANMTKQQYAELSTTPDGARVTNVASAADDSPSTR